MRLLTIAVLALSFLWFGYWAVGSRGLDSGVTGWLEGLKADGNAVEWSDVSVAGFPNRFDLTISDPAIGDPMVLQWRADFFQMLTRSYAPYHLIGVWPDSQSLTTPLATLTLVNDKARASVRFSPVPSLPLDHVELVVDQGSLTSTAGWVARFDQARFATRQRPDLVNAHQLGLDVIGLTPDPALRLAVQAATPLPEQLAHLHADVTLQPDAPLDRHAFGAEPLRLLRLDLTDLRFEWGSIGVQAQGTLTRDASGYGEGQIIITLKDWRGLISLLQASGSADPVLVGTLSRALEVLEGLNGTPDVLDVPVTFAGGRGTIAGLPLLPAPQF
jgi:hypothetical protein